MYDIEKYYNAGTVSEAVTLLNEHPGYQDYIRRKRCSDQDP